MTEKQKKLFIFFMDKNNKSKLFTCKEAAEYTGYAETTINKYINEKLINNNILKKEKNNFKVINFGNMNEKKFEELLSQGRINKTDEELYIDKLKEKSFEQFLLAIEIYNRPSLKNKIEVFSILLICSWELLLKAKLIKDSNNIDSIFDKEGKTKKISKLILTIFKDKDNAIRRNLNEIIEIRNNSIHLFIENFRSDISRYFQSAIINYIDFYEYFFDKIPLRNETKGMFSIVIDKNDLNDVFLLGDKNENIKKLILETENKLHKYENCENDRVMVNINYSIYKTKDKDADIYVKYTNKGANIKEVKVPEDPNNIFTFKFGEVIKEINKKLKEDKNNNINKIQINQSNLTAIINFKKIKDNKKYTFTFGNTSKYSYELIKYIVNQIIENNELAKLTPQKVKKLQNQ